jgi:hypothetical protein
MTNPLYQNHQKNPRTQQISNKPNHLFSSQISSTEDLSSNHLKKSEKKHTLMTPNIKVYGNSDTGQGNPIVNILQLFANSVMLTLIQKENRMGMSLSASN